MHNVVNTLATSFLILSFSLFSGNNDSDEFEFTLDLTAKLAALECENVKKWCDNTISFVLVESSSLLQVKMTCLTAWMSSIPAHTPELSTL